MPDSDATSSRIGPEVLRSLNGILTALGKIFPVISGTATSATAGAATLPSAPAGFLVITLPSGASAKVPYYND